MGIKALAQVFQDSAQCARSPSPGQPDPRRRPRRGIRATPPAACRSSRQSRRRSPFAVSMSRPRSGCVDPETGRPLPMPGRQRERGGRPRAGTAGASAHVLEDRSCPTPVRHTAAKAASCAGARRAAAPPAHEPDRRGQRLVPVLSMSRVPAAKACALASATSGAGNDASDVPGGASGVPDAPRRLLAGLHSQPGRDALPSVATAPSRSWRAISRPQQGRSSPGSS